jgi:hypothetical protein
MIDAHVLKLVLNRIAISHAVEPEFLRMGDKGAVIYCKGNELLCLCHRGSHYWNEIEAEVVTIQTIERASRKNA